MIRTTLRFLSAEVRGLHAAAYVLALCALSSSLLALVRDRLLAHTFGAGTELDIYYAAFRIPDLLFVSLGAMVSVYVLIPQLMNRDMESQREYIDTIVTGFSFFSIVATGLLFWWVPFFLAHLYPFLSDAQHVVATSLTRIMLLQPLLLGFSNICAAITQSRHRFLLYSLSPLLYSFGAIVGILVFFPWWGLAGLAWGIVLGAVLHLGIQIPSLWGDGFVRIPRVFSTRALYDTVRISLPRAGALSMGQVSFLGLSAIAGALGSGALSVFIFAYNLSNVPLAIIGASYSVAAYPTLAGSFARGAREEFVAHLATAARAVLFWSLPISALVIVLRAHIVRVILGSGHFDWTDTRLTAALLGVLSASLVAQGFLLLLPRGYHAARRSLIPLVFASGIAGASVLFAYGFLILSRRPDILPFAEYFFRLVDVPGTPVVAIALGFSLASLLGASLYVWHFNRTFGGFVSQLSRTFFESISASLATGSVAYLVLTSLGALSIFSTLGTIILQATLAGTLGMSAGLIVYHVLGSREYQEVRLAVADRLWRMSTTVLGNRVLSSAEVREM